jgi:propanol-preferring alcohol dehydrogenase
MKAALLFPDGRLEVREVDEPQADGWALIETKAAGVCGTELHMLDGMLVPPRFPFVLGHEVAGVVVEAPLDAAVVKGDRVVVHNFVGCGRCHWCRTGRMSICTSPIGQIGFSLEGGYRDVVRVPPANLVPLPDAVAFETGAVLGCSGLTAVHSTRLAGVALGSTVVVNGIGGVGLSILQVARAAGAEVIAVADTQAKAQLAQELGAKETVLVVTAEDYRALPEQIRRLTDGRGADFFFELVGTRETIGAGVALLGRAGSFVCIGYTQEHVVADPLVLMDSELRIISSIAGDRQDLETAIRLAASGRLRVHVDARYSLSEIGVAVERLRKREVCGRGVIVW